MNDEKITIKQLLQSLSPKQLWIGITTIVAIFASIFTFMFTKMKDMVHKELKAEFQIQINDLNTKICDFKKEITDYQDYTNFIEIYMSYFSAKHSKQYNAKRYYENYGKLAQWVKEHRDKVVFKTIKKSDGRIESYSYIIYGKNNLTFWIPFEIIDRVLWEK